MRALAAAAVALLALAALPAPASAVDDLLVGGAHGLVAYPEGTPKGLVAVLHGYGHKAESHRGHLAHLAEQGWVAFAMDYTGEGMPLAAGKADTCAAAAALDVDGPRHLYSVSMGSAVAGMVLADPACGPWKTWVNNEGMTSIEETWAEAKVLAPANAFAAQAVADIEAECGGTPADAPLCYQERMAVSRVAEFRGLEGVVQTHGLNDGLVPYDQGREMKAALAAVGIPSDFYTAVRSGEGAEGTTVTGYVPGGPGGAGFAGHGTESNDAHMLTWLSFGLLDAVLAGDLVPSGKESVVDAEAGVVPLLP